MTQVRNYAWALSPVVTVVVPLMLLGAVVVTNPLLGTLSLALGVLTAFCHVRGALWYRSSRQSRSLGVLLALPVLPVLPLVSVVHSVGAVWELADPPEGFRVTAKAT